MSEPEHLLVSRIFTHTKGRRHPLYAAVLEVPKILQGTEVAVNTGRSIRHMSFSFMPI